MALIKCKECGHDVSSLADTCQNCGIKIKNKAQEIGEAVAGILIIITIFYFSFHAIFDTKSEEQPTQQTQEQPIQPTELAAEKSLPVQNQSEVQATQPPAQQPKSQSDELADSLGIKLSDFISRWNKFNAINLPAKPKFEDNKYSQEFTKRTGIVLLRDEKDKAILSSAMCLLAQNDNVTDAEVMIFIAAMKMYIKSIDPSVPDNEMHQLVTEMATSLSDIKLGKKSSYYEKRFYNFKYFIMFVDGMGVTFYANKIMTK
jgi:hypothetical protein